MSLWSVLVAPFAEYTFMRSALVACMALAVASGPLGTLLLLRRMGLVADVLSHAVMPRAAGRCESCGVLFRVDRCGSPHRVAARHQSRSHARAARHGSRDRWPGAGPDRRHRERRRCRAGADLSANRNSVVRSGLSAHHGWQR